MIDDSVVEDQLDVGDALLIARCTDEGLAGAADELSNAEADGDLACPGGTRRVRPRGRWDDVPQDPGDADPAP